MKVEDIKFRGLRLDKTGREIGLLTYKPWGLCIQDEKDHSHFSSVIPETVGQFTGVKDKNGVDIYTGDKLQRISGFYTVIWSQDNCAFMKENSTGGILSLNNCECEVIGNIHEQGAN